MKSIFNIKSFIFLLTLGLIFSCEENEESYPLFNEIFSLQDILADNPDLSLTLEAINLVGNVEDFENGIWTIFAPTNSAWENYFSANGVSGLGEIDNLEQLLLYHVRPTTNAEFSNTLQSGYYPMAAYGSTGDLIDLHIMANNGFVLGGIANTVEGQFDIGTSNGVLHKIDAVVPIPVIPDVSIPNSDYSLFVQAVQYAGLEDALRSDGPFTVFAPNNAAFTSFMQMVTDQLGYTQLTDVPLEFLRPLLLYHVLAGENSDSGELGGDKMTMQGETLNFSGTVNDQSGAMANVALADVQFNNGIVHGIDRVLITTEFSEAVLDATLNLYERILNNGYTSFIEAVDLTGLDDELINSTAYTSFVPTNDALALLIGSLGEDYSSLADFDTAEEIDALRNLLEYHILAGVIESSTLSDGDILMPLQGEEIVVINDGSSIALEHKFGGPANVFIADVNSTTGIFHVINKVMLTDAAVDFFGLAPSTEPEYGFEIYDDELNTDEWWTGHWDCNADFDNSELVKSGEKSIKATWAANWGGFQIGYFGPEVAYAPYSTFNASLYSVDGGAFTFVLSDQWGAGQQVVLPAGEWVEVSIPLSDIIGDATTQSTLIIQESSGQPLTTGVLYMDEVGLDVVIPQSGPSLGLEFYTEEVVEFSAQNWSWDCTVDVANTENPRSGDYSMKIDYIAGFGGAQFHIDEGNTPSLSPFSTLDVSLFSATGGGFNFALNEQWGNAQRVEINANEWTDVSIPLSDLGVSGQELYRLVIQEHDGNADAVVFVDNIGFN